MHNKKIVIQVDGGIGRNICAIPSISVIGQDYPIYVISSCPEIFEYNPYIERVYPLSNKYLFDDVIKGNIFKYPEPYHNSLYINEESHLINAFADELGLVLVDEQPEIYLQQDELEWARQFLYKYNNKPILIYQPFGTGMQEMNHMVTNPQVPTTNDLLAHSMQLLQSYQIYTYIDKSYRSLSMQQALFIADNLTQKYNVLLMSDKQFNHQAVIHPKLSIRQWCALVYYCDNIVSIDSCLPHIANAFQKSGVVFWGATSINNLGYRTFHNIYHKDRVATYTPYRMKSDNPHIHQKSMNFTNDEILIALRTIL